MACTSKFHTRSELRAAFCLAGVFKICCFSIIAIIALLTGSNPSSPIFRKLIEMNAASASAYFEDLARAALADDLGKLNVSQPGAYAFSCPWVLAGGLTL
jgi:hypothetical protein